MAYLQWLFPLSFCFVHYPLTFSFIFIWRLLSKNQRNHSKENRTAEKATSTETSPGKYYLNPMVAYLRMYVSVVIFLRSFFANLHFHFCLALIFYVFITLVLRYFRCMYLQNFTQHYNTTVATTNKRVGTEIVILFTSLYHNIF